MRDVHWGIINLAVSVVFLVICIAINQVAIGAIPNLVVASFYFGRASV